MLRYTVAVSLYELLECLSEFSRRSYYEGFPGPTFICLASLKKTFQYYSDTKLSWHPSETNRGRSRAAVWLEDDRCGMTRVSVMLTTGQTAARLLFSSWGRTRLKWGIWTILSFADDVRSAWDNNVCSDCYRVVNTQAVECFLYKLTVLLHVENMRNRSLLLQYTSEQSDWFHHWKQAVGLVSEAGEHHQVWISFSVRKKKKSTNEMHRRFP